MTNYYCASSSKMVFVLCFWFKFKKALFSAKSEISPNMSDFVNKISRVGLFALLLS